MPFSKKKSRKRNTIPKVIYMCHKKLDHIKIYSQNWKKLNPTWTIKLYDDNLCKIFLMENYPKIITDIFEYIKDGPIKADLWRLCILNKYGGLYVDADIEPIVPLNEYIDETDDFVTCISMIHQNPKNNQTTLSHRFAIKNQSGFKNYLNPHFILSHKNNIMLENAIKTYIDYYNSNLEYEYWDWSVVFNLSKQFSFFPKLSKNISIYYHNNLKYKFLVEDISQHCRYNNRIVLNNRYDTYFNHNFIK